MSGRYTKARGLRPWALVYSTKHTHPVSTVKSENREDCQKVGEAVRESGILSESRGETRRVREAAATSSGKRRRHRQGNGDVIVRETATSLSAKRRRNCQGNGDVIVRETATSSL